MKLLRFYKDEEGWFLDAPEYIENELGTKADLQMVSGADSFLHKICEENYGYSFINSDYIRRGITGQVTIEVFITPVAYAETLMRLPDEGWYIDIRSGELMWLCSVTKWVFNGEYPQFIYYKVL